MERYDLPAEKLATPEEAGVLRVATETDEKNCGCEDAAITPKNLYNLLGCRKANTFYKAGAVVACPYHVEFLLICVTAGSTATGSLDTTNVTKGQVITDGGAKWTVIAKAIIDVSISGKNITFTFADGTTKVVTTQDTEKPGDMTDYIVESYRNGTEWYEVYKSGKVRQGGHTSGETTVTFLKPFANDKYIGFHQQAYAWTGGAYMSYFTFKSQTPTNALIGKGMWIAEGQGA